MGMMTARFAVSSRRRRKSSGNTIVETVFTLLPTFALIFFMSDMGLMLFRWSTLQNAVREGARFAITFQLVTNGTTYTGQDAAIKAKVAQYAMNLVSAADSPQTIFVNYYTTTAVNTPIATGGNLPGNIVEVAVKNISLTWLAPLSGSYGATIPFYRSTTPITLSVYSSDILGGFPVGVTTVAR
jgi:Flp pilus assembly protein TadG